MSLLYSDAVNCRGSAGLLALRAVAGTALMYHGCPKIHDPFHWLDKASNPPPGILQALAALSEFGGGLALILGLFTSLAALGILCTMATGIVMVHLQNHDPFIAKPPEHPHSYEQALNYLAVAVVMLLTGPGRLSLDALLFRGGCCGRKARVQDSEVE